MSKKHNFIVPLLTITLVLGCNSAVVDDSLILNHYNLDTRGNEIINLPKELKEVSGLAYIDDDHLITHNDEEGIVYKFSISSGKIVSEYFIGQKEIEKDFEGIAVAKDSVYLVTSGGILFKFSLSDKNEQLEYDMIETSLSSKNNVEGLCYDNNTNTLLLACKDDAGRGLKNFKAVYEFSLNKMELIREPRFLISLKVLKRDFDIKDFSPSGIEINPHNGNVFLISAKTEVIVELDSEGNLLNVKKMNDKKHKQPEGITFLSDGTMVIADESNGKEAKLTIIPYAK